MNIKVIVAKIAVFVLACQYSLSSVQFSRSFMSSSLWPHRLQYSRPPCPLPTLGIYSNSCPLSRWRHPTVPSSVIPFSSSASGSFPMSQFFTSGGLSIAVSSSASVLPMNIQDWFPLGWTGWISLQSKGHSRVFSNTTVQKHQFFGAQLLLWSNSQIHTWLLEKLQFHFWVYIQRRQKKNTLKRYLHPCIHCRTIHSS